MNMEPDSLVDPHGQKLAGKTRSPLNALIGWLRISWETSLGWCAAGAAASNAEHGYWGWAAFWFVVALKSVIRDEVRQVIREEFEEED